MFNFARLGRTSLRDFRNVVHEITQPGRRDRGASDESSVILVLFRLQHCRSRNTVPAGFVREQMSRGAALKRAADSHGGSLESQIRSLEVLATVEGESCNQK